MKKAILFIIFFSLFFASCDTLKEITDEIFRTNKIKFPEVKIKDNFKGKINYKIPGLNYYVGKVVNKEMQKMIQLASEEIIESYDVTDFQYAILYGDNSSLYESSENYKKLSNFAYYLLDLDAPATVQARNLNTAGEILFATSHFESAEKSINESYSIYKNQNLLNSTEAILTMSNLGLLYQTMGKYGLAEIFTKDALNARETNNQDTTGYAATLNNLGVLYKVEGKYTESENYFNKSADYLKTKIGEDNIQYAIVLNNLAMLYQVLNKLDEAEKNLNTALKIAKTVAKENSPTYGRLKINLALLYQLQGRYSKSEQIYKEIIDMNGQRLGKNHPDYATLLRGLASLYMKMGKYSDVEPLLNQAEEIYKAKFGEQHPVIAKTLFEKAVYFQTIEDFKTANTLLEQSLEIQQKTLENHHPDIADTYEQLAINYWATKNPNIALSYYKKALDEYIFQINTYFEAMSEGEKTKFWNDIQPKFILFYNFAAQYYNQIPELPTIVYNYHIQTKALLLNSSRKVKDRILSSNDPNLIEKYNKWQDMKNYTAKLFTLSNEELKERNINLDSIILVTDKLEKEIATISNDFKTAYEKKDINSSLIKNKLNLYDAAIEIIRTDKYAKYAKTDSVFYIALILTKNEENVGMTVFNDGNIMETDYINQYHKAIMNGKDMGKFYTYFWKNINEKLNTINNVYLSIDGIYNQININTILLPNNQYVIDKYLIYNLTNTKDIISLKDNFNNHQSLQNKTATLIGFPDYLLDLPEDIAVVPPLPGTKQEVENINELLKTKNWIITEFMGKDANEVNVKKLDNPYVLHIATHGYFIEKSDEQSENSRSFGIEPQRAIQNPLLRSGLLLAGADKTILELNDKDNEGFDDGILNAFEASVLKLDKTRLVILSACQTGLGDIKTGEGVYGLQRSFQIAGAQSIITSLWQVSDEGTRDLMSEFYKNWLQSGNEFEAFRKAQMFIKDKYKYPYYWGAFVLIGK